MFLYSGDLNSKHLNYGNILVMNFYLCAMHSNTGPYIVGILNICGMQMYNIWISTETTKQRFLSNFWKLDSILKFLLLQTNCLE